MKKNTVRAYVALAVIFAAYSVLSFAIPFNKNGTFWVSYIFSAVALLSQVYVFKSAFKGEDTVKSKFYGFPIAQIGVVYAGAQIILGLAFMAFSKVIPMWVALAVSVVMFAIAAVGLISSEAMRDEIVVQDVKIKKDVTCMRELQSIAYSLPKEAKDEEVKKALENLSESFRYSDPVSSDKIAEAESELKTALLELQKAVLEENKEIVISVCKNVESLLKERNRLCKLNK